MVNLANLFLPIDFCAMGNKFGISFFAKRKVLRRFSKGLDSYLKFSNILICENKPGNLLVILKFFD